MKEAYLFVERELIILIFIDYRQLNKETSLAQNGSK